MITSNLIKVFLRIKKVIFVPQSGQDQITEDLYEHTLCQPLHSTFSDALKSADQHNSVYKNTNTCQPLSDLELLSSANKSELKFWATEFKCGRKSLGDDERLGCPNTATTDENSAKVHQIVLGDHRIRERDSRGYEHVKKRVFHILNQHLGMRKLFARWVPRLLTLDQKRVGMNISNALLAQFMRNTYEFWRRLITVDETWIYRYTLETKLQSRQWAAKWEPAPKKSKNCFFGWKSDDDCFLR
ncbi:histone-lysine N-methyltransferase SETMAR [Trichonephila clavipes]|nr:histone-lysine N-methyltransferase SETMAR [Trichonephila clavipes]